MSIPSKSTIQRRKRALRKLIDSSKDDAVIRIAYGMEIALRWATEDTVGWEPLDETAKGLAETLRAEFELADAMLAERAK